MEALIELTAIRKAFGRTVALEDVSLRVEADTIVGLIGPNGAGKTTLLKIIAGLVRPDSGVLSVSIPLPRIGAAVDRPGFYPYLSGRDNLVALCLTGGMRARDAKRKVAATLELVGLAGAADRRFGGYSTGMGQRLAMAAALLPDPRLLILDEPASGLDPAGVAQLRVQLQDIRRAGCTVLVSSHLLGEVEQVCDSVAILDRGRVVASGPIESLTTGRTVWRLAYADAARASRAADILASGFTTSIDGRMLSAVSRGDPSVEPLPVVAAAGLLPSEAARDQPNLEEIYLRLTGSGHGGPQA